MLKRKYRLSAKTRVEKSRSLENPFFTLRIAENNLSYNRFRFVVSKKVDKRAVVRNKIRRKFNECIRSLWEEIKTGFDLIFYIKKSISEEEEKNLSMIIKETFIKNQLLK